MNEPIHCDFCMKKVPESRSRSVLISRHDNYSDKALCDECLSGAIYYLTHERGANQGGE